MKKATILTAIVLVLAGCFSPWQGDKGTFTVSIGTSAGNGRTAVPWNENYHIENLTHEITLSDGPGPKQTREVEGIETLTFTVTPGRWHIAVEAYALSDGDRILIAVGSRIVDIKPGLNELVTVEMGQPPQKKPPIEGMEWIPAGTFMMYSTQQEFQVTLTQGFYMGKYPVTQAEYEAVMGVNPSGFDTNPDDGETQGKRPVEMVSWYDTLVFCNKLSVRAGLAPAYSINGSTDPATWGNVPTDDIDAAWNAVVIVPDSNGYRLPTEAQWEYACRAGTTTRFNNGNDDYTDTAQVGAVAWYAVNSNNKTHEVGLKAPNAWGLYDMHGNVSEWCRDWYRLYNGLPQTDPTGGTIGVSGITAANYRIQRGGSWRSENGSPVSSDSRSRGNTFYRDNETGFRLVLPSDGVPVANYDDEDFGQGATIHQTFNVANLDQWNSAASAISNGGSGGTNSSRNYVINVTADFTVPGTAVNTNTFGSSSYIKVSIRGAGRTLTLSPEIDGEMLYVGNYQNIILWGVTLKGRPYVYNSTAMSSSVVRITGESNRTGGTFTMNSGKITGNSFLINSSQPIGGGVTIFQGTFTMNGGEISGNSVRTENPSGGGGGVCVRQASGYTSVFIMNGGKICGNTITTSRTNDQGGGGVFMMGGTFKISNGIICGSDAIPVEERNTAVDNSTAQDSKATAAFYKIGGTSQCVDSNGVVTGDLASTDNTIEVVNGELQ